MEAEMILVKPIFGEFPSQYAERVGQEYARASAQKDKKHKGQFFTPLAISRFMGNLAAASEKQDVSILDSGCGLLLWAGPVRAQWSGSLELSGGLGAS